MSSSIARPEALSCETPAPGLVVYQPKRGYRYTTDPFLLAGWALEDRWEGEFVDGGTGSGILALLLGRLGLPGTGVDVEPSWIELARRSARESAQATSFQCMDIRQHRSTSAEIALANPPYFRRTEGTLSSDLVRAAARHELTCTLEEFIGGLAGCAPRVAVVLRSEREADARDAFTHLGLALARRCAVDQALVLLDARRGHTRALVDERVALRGPDGVVSDRVTSWYRVLGARPPVNAVAGSP